VHQEGFLTFVLPSSDVATVTGASGDEEREGY
jgi:hypothetical protein